MEVLLDLRGTSTTQSRIIVEVNDKLAKIDKNVTGLQTQVGQLEREVGSLENIVDSQGQQIGNLADQLLDKGDPLRWTSPQFAWNKSVLSATGKAEFVEVTIPQIKQTAEQHTNLVIRIVGRVDRSSQKENNDGQADVGKARAATIAKLLKKNDVDVAVETWGFSYAPNCRQTDIYLEPK